MRIVSLVPSATEILYALGLGGQIVGVTHECDHPADAVRKPKIISTVIDPERLTSDEIDDAVRRALRAGESLYRVDEAALRAAQPDVLLAQALCEVCAVDTSTVSRIVSLLPRKPEVLALNPHTLEDILQDVLRVGARLGRQAEAADCVEALRARLARVAERVAGLPPPGVFCLEWLKPLMGSGHWVPEQVAAAGGRELIGKAGTPSRYVTEEELASAAPEVVVLMACGLTPARVRQEMAPLAEASWWRGLPAVRNGRVHLVDGPAYFNRSGPRVVEGVEQLAELFHPVRLRNPLGRATIIA